MDAGAPSKTATVISVDEQFRSIVGSDHVRPAISTDSVAGVQPKLVVVPGNETELAEILRVSNDAGLAVVPCGGGTKLGWGNPPARADLILSTARLNRIVEHVWADLTVTVEAGCTIEKLQEVLARHGQRLALDPLWPDKATIGGVLSTNDSGALRLRFGALRDLIIGVTLALPDGTLASSGGKVVKNVAGYDLPKLATGALGTLGVITRAVFRLHPLPRKTRTFAISVSDVEQTQHFIHVVQDSKLAHTSLQSEFSGQAPPISHILFEGTEAGLDAQEKQLRTLGGSARVLEAPPSVWSARQEVWTLTDPENRVIAKISILPANLGQTMELLQRTAHANHLRWRALVYATGIGCLRLEALPEALRDTLQSLRRDLERQGGSLVALHRSEKVPVFDVWGNAGDTLPLMKAIKHQLDPRNTLNPGRFVGGI